LAWQDARADGRSGGGVSGNGQMRVASGRDFGFEESGGFFRARGDRRLKEGLA